jgi:hypothetical protein
VSYLDVQFILDSGIRRLCNCPSLLIEWVLHATAMPAPVAAACTSRTGGPYQNVRVALHGQQWISHMHSPPASVRQTGAATEAQKILYEPPRRCVSVGARNCDGVTDTGAYHCGLVVIGVLRRRLQACAERQLSTSGRIHVPARKPLPPRSALRTRRGWGALVRVPGTAQLLQMGA